MSERDGGNLELLECLLVALRLGHLQRVELHRLGERPALAHRHHVADLRRRSKFVRFMEKSEYQGDAQSLTHRVRIFLSLDWKNLMIVRG